MQEEYKTIKTERYPISCKSYISDLQPNGIILGVHGFAGDKESSALKALAEASCERGTSLICFDFPAHGTSVASDDMLSVKNCMDDLLLIAEHCRKEHPNERKFLFATSFGGYIALLCIKELTDFSIVLRAPAVTMAEHILTDLLDTTPEAFKKAGTITCGFDRKICLPFSFYEELQKHKIADCVCDNPVLIIRGDMDDVVPYSDIVAFCSCHKIVKLRTVYGADHRFKKTGEIEQVIESAISYWKL